MRITLQAKGDAAQAQEEVALLRHQLAQRSVLQALPNDSFNMGTWLSRKFERSRSARSSGRPSSAPNARLARKGSRSGVRPFGAALERGRWWRPACTWQAGMRVCLRGALPRRRACGHTAERSYGMLLRCCRTAVEDAASGRRRPQLNGLQLTAEWHKSTT